MSEQRATWLQRLVGSDNAPLAVLEDQLIKSKQEVERLAAELAQERERRASLERESEQRLQQVHAHALSAEQAEARAVSIQQSTEGQQTAYDQLADRHKKTTAELAAARAQLARQRDESAKQSKTLAAVNAQLERAEMAAQTARRQAGEVDVQRARAEQEADAAREHSRELERAAETSAKELADAKRRLQAVETRASTIEHELAQTKESQQRAQVEAERLGTELQRAAADGELAQRMTNDTWRALEHSVGDAATIALALVLAAASKSTANGAGAARATLADATSSLKDALERQTRCHVTKLEAVEDGIVADLRAEQALASGGATAQWLVAFSVAYLEQATGLELAVESATTVGDRLKYRLQTSAVAG
jgi:chromosome segregation ATPase